MYGVGYEQCYAKCFDICCANALPVSRSAFVLSSKDTAL